MARADAVALREPSPRAAAPRALSPRPSLAGSRAPSCSTAWGRQGSERSEAPAGRRGGRRVTSLCASRLLALRCHHLHLTPLQAGSRRLQNSSPLILTLNNKHTSKKCFQKEIQHLLWGCTTMTFFKASLPEPSCTCSTRTVRPRVAVVSSSVSVRISLLQKVYFAGHPQSGLTGGVLRSRPSGLVQALARTDDAEPISPERAAAEYKFRFRPRSSRGRGEGRGPCHLQHVFQRCLHPTARATKGHPGLSRAMGQHLAAFTSHRWSPVPEHHVVQGRLGNAVHPGDAGHCSLCEPSSKQSPSGSLALWDVELPSFLQTHMPSTTAPQDPYSPHSQERNNSKKASQFPVSTSGKEGLGSPKDCAVGVMCGHPHMQAEHRTPRAGPQALSLRKYTGGLSSCSPERGHRARTGQEGGTALVHMAVSP